MFFSEFRGVESKSDASLGMQQLRGETTWAVLRREIAKHSKLTGLQGLKGFRASWAFIVFVKFFMGVATLAGAVAATTEYDMRPREDEGLEPSLLSLRWHLRCLSFDMCCEDILGRSICLRTFVLQCHADQAPSFENRGSALHVVAFTAGVASLAKSSSFLPF